MYNSIPQAEMFAPFWRRLGKKGEKCSSEREGKGMKIPFFSYKKTEITKKRINRLTTDAALSVM